jgi:pimeloyl-ACP methyl ester carboxylesterase
MIMIPLRPALALFLLAPPVAEAQSPALDRTPSRFALYDGVRLHYKSLGLGATAVVFVHGWVSDLTVWREQLPVVDGRVRAIFLDLPGFGRSDKPDVAYSMNYFAGAVDAVLHAAGVERAVLVGHSMGTPVIRQYYRKFPAKVVGLVVVDGALRPFLTDTMKIRAFVAQFEGPDFAANLERMFDGLSGSAASPALKASLARMALATPQRVAVSAMRGQLDLAIWKNDPIDVPVLAVMSPNPGWSADYVAYVKHLVPGVEYETLEGVGHFLMLERPEEFNALLLDFLRSRRVLR